MVEHVDPDLSVLDYVGGKSLFDDLPGCHRVDHDSTVLQVVFTCFPSKLVAIFKSLDDPFFFKQGKGAIVFERLAEECKGVIEILKALFPADVVPHGVEFNIFGGLRIDYSDSGHWPVAVRKELCSVEHKTCKNYR